MSKAAIIPYKKVELQLGPLDLETDQVGLQRRGKGEGGRGGEGDRRWF
jgi:hypothetical protein